MTLNLRPDSNTFLNELLITAKYKDGGRGPLFYDCWGLTRYARSELYNLPLLPSYGHISADDKRKLTKACAEVIRSHVFEWCDPWPSAIATVWQGGACTHIALVIEREGQLAVLEINKGSGIRIVALDEFQRLYSDVRFYND